jgi:hypothetical protein
LRAEYLKRLESRRAAADQHQRSFRTLGNLRLAVVVAGALLAWWNYWTLPVSVGAFLFLVVLHDRIDRRFTAEKRAVAFYERGLARLDNRWMGSGPTGERFRDPAHPYADDLDLFGNGSVFQLLSSARTSAGEDTLAGWLLAPAAREEAESRQKAVEELRPGLDLREDLALLGEDVQAQVHPNALRKWGEQRAEEVTVPLRLIAFLLSAATVIAFSGYMLQLWPLTPLLLIFLLELLFSMTVRERVNRILEAVEVPGHDLQLLSHLLERLERETYRSSKLIALKKQIETGGVPASVQIAKLHRLVDFQEWSHNQMFTLVAKPLLWSTQVAFGIERWRQKSGEGIARWLDAVAEIEALSSLAAYASEHPDDSFPELSIEGPVFHGEGIAHPLLPQSTAVRNDVRLDSTMQLLLISGSNMSGKSTLLRSTGLNAVLAWAGAPVRANRLRVSRLRVAASMRVQDSIQDGKSRFYAEITRLRQIVDLTTGEDQVLFLLDELLSGTNSHDRRIGAEAIVRSLVEQGALGLVTTHDLALAHIADVLAPKAVNVHFEDHIEDGRIAFDYRMRPGIVQKSNALELMRSVGLSV